MNALDIKWVGRLLARYMQRYHEGPIVRGPEPLDQVACEACGAAVIYDAELEGVFMVDFPPQVRL